MRSWDRNVFWGPDKLFNKESAASRIMVNMLR